MMKSLFLFVGLVTALRFENQTVPTQKDVELERSKLDQLSQSLTSLFANEKIAHSPIAPALRFFTHNVQVVLNETKTLTAFEAMKKLRAASASGVGLIADLEKQQETLMKENVESRESYLMGVLMTHKQAPMTEQLEILKSDDFVGLDVSKQLLRVHDDKKSLYLQAATWLDAHNASGFLARQKVVKSKEDVAATFEKRVAALERENEERHAIYKKTVQDLTASAKKGNKHAMAILKKAEHMYKKATAQTTQYIDNMKAAAVAIRNGDVKALDKARDALTRSLEALQAKRNGGMIYFLQEGSALFERDCPFCAAQCVEKCHNKGEPYVQCLGECADAGKR